MEGPLSPALLSIFVVFARMGLMGFGGPVALIALMESEVRSRHWMNASDFGERFVLCKLLPGPIAFQMALWVGHTLRGFLGGIVAGLGFLLPGAIFILILAATYQRVGNLAIIAGLISGMRLGALVVIWDSAIRLFEPYRRELLSWMYLVAGAALFLWVPRGEPFIIIAAGVVSLFARRPTKLSLSPLTVLFSLFWIHFKAGAFTFGTGLAIVPMLQHAVVDLHGWLTSAEFLDAVAFGQVTPGPVTLTSTFVGYRVAGILGACLATAGMYLPGTIVILGLMPHIYGRLRGAKGLALFSRGAVPAVIGCIVGAGIGLSSPILIETNGVVLCFGFLILNTWLKLSSWKVVLSAGIVYAIIS